MHPWPPIGDNIARLRNLAGLTQEALAERAQVSVDLVRRLEQGNRKTALVSNLYKIANALDIPLSLMLSQQPVLNRTEVPVDTHSGIDSLRQVLEPTEAGGQEELEPISVDDLSRSARYAWRLYRSGEFASLAAVLPTALRAGAALAEEVDGSQRDRVFTEMSHLYYLAANIAVQLGYGDLGFVAAKEALRVANRVDDPLVPANATNAMTFVLVRQGRLREAESLAIRVAEGTEPRFAKASPDELVTWGGILWPAMTAAARLGRVSAAEDDLNLMRLAALRLNTDLVDDYLTWFGPTVVGMGAVSFYAETGDYAKALHLAEKVPASGGSATITRMRYLLDVANAQAHEYRPNDAVATLMQVYDRAAEWMRYQVLAREVVGMLLDAKGISRDNGGQLRKLADHLYVAA